MKPYHLPPLLVGLVTSLLGAPVLLTVTLAAFLYFYCKHFFCEDFAEDRKLLREIRQDRREFQRLTHQ